MILEDQIIIEAKEQIEAGISITPLWKSTGFIRDLSQRAVDILLDTLEVCFQSFGIHTAYLIRREIPKATKAGSRNVAATPVSVPPHAAATPASGSQHAAATALLPNATATSSSLFQNGYFCQHAGPTTNK